MTKKSIVVLLPVLLENSELGERYRALFHEFEKQYGDKYTLVYEDSATVSPEVLQEACAIIGNPKPELLSGCRQLEWLQLDFAGTDRYIGTVRRMEGLSLTNASGGFGRVIAEHMLAGLMALYRRLPEYVRNQEQRVWQDMGREQSVFGRNILVIGTGDIGSSFAGMMKCFGCELTGINRRGKAAAGFDRTDVVTNLSKYISSADIIACCVPKNKSTDKLISREIIGMMKTTAVVINVGRGNCIDEEALCVALNEGRISGAALDVFMNEPLDTDASIWHTRNLLITPHVAGKTYGHLEDTVERVLDICLKNLYRYVEGKALINLVDKETGYRIETT